MRRVRLAVLALLALPLVAEQPVNQLKGFNANNVYSTHDIDSINVFNGNLTVTIPVGQQYPVGGGLSYGLTLVSNWNTWDAEITDGEYPPYPSSRTLTPMAEGLCNIEDGITAAYPHRRANAGLGWTLTLGRLYPPGDPTVSGWTYESPDGADHLFSDKLHFGDTTAAGVYYTRDGSYLRMQTFDEGTVNARRTIEFPDGTVHTFYPPSRLGPWMPSGLGPWMPVRIENHNSANWLTIDYVSNSGTGGVDWKLTDSQGRVQKVHFTRKRWDGSPDTTRWLVQSVELMAFTPPNTAQRYATYGFEYTEVTLTRPIWHERCPDSINQTTIQQLTALKLPDDPSTTAVEADQYSFAYDNAPVEAPGVLWKATLPTGGAIRWTPITYQKPQWAVSDDVPYLQLSVGVGTRTLLQSASAATGLNWTYQPLLDGAYDNIAQPPREARTVVTDPLGNKTVSYFSVAVRDVVSPWRLDEYGKPFTRKMADSSGTRLLSAVTYPPTVTPDAAAPLTGAIRASYVRYESDGSGGGSMATEDNWRLASTRMLTRDGTPDDYVDTNSTLFDGFGHYRSVEVRGPSGPTKTTLTTYNGTTSISSNVLTVFPTSAKWILGKFGSIKVTQSQPSLPDETAESLYCFEPTTGFLNWKRTKRSAGTNDLLTLYTDSGNGNVAAEDFYGGDGASLGTSTCGETLSLGTSRYQIQHSWSYGVRASSQYRGVSFKSLDLTIDTTGLASSSRDTAGVETTYRFNTRGQLTEVRPAGEAWSEYSYAVDPSGDPRATVTAKRRPAGTSASATPLTEARYYYDALGRLIQQRQQMPGLAGGNLWSAATTEYDALGRAHKQSVPVGVPFGGYGALSAPVTVQSFDALGRVIQTTKPDNKVIGVVYESGNTIERTEEVKTSPSASSQVTMREIYDAHGRLVTVVEDATGSPVSTWYEYDEGDRLKGVRDNQTDSLAVQKRTFDYDGAGLLTSEQHPESGLTSYLYDARGHVTTRTEPGLHVLTYTYDNAERLLTENHNGPAMKEYTYDASAAPGDKSLGKMITAKRHNPQPSLGGDVTVTETFVYNGVGGRLSSKTTAVSSPGSLPKPTFTDTYAYDQFGNTESVTYPGCTFCGGLTPPARTVTSVYESGLLRRVSGYTSANEPIGYHPNGMLRTLRRLNVNNTDGPLYQQGIAADGMSRPSSIDVSNYCSGFRIDTQPPLTKTVSQGAPANITVSAQGATSYEWYRLGETQPIATTQTLSVAVNQNTSFWVRAKNGTCTVDSIVSAVSVSSSCAADATISSSPVVNLGAPGSASVPETPGGTYLWELVAGSMGTITSAVNGRTVTFLAGCSGSLTLKASVTVGGCTSVSTYPISIVVPSFTMTATPNPINSGGSSTISASSSGGPWSIKWSDGSTLPQHSVSPAATTVYHIVEVNGCTGSYGSVTVTVNGSCPTPDANIESVSVMNLGATETAFVPSTPGATYAWDLVAGSMGTIIAGANAQTVQFRAGCGGNLTLRARVTNSCGTSESTRSISILPPPLFTVTATPPEINPGETSTLSVSGGPIAFWTRKWEGGSTQIPRTVNPTVTTSYTIGEVNGCPGSYGTGTVTVNAPPPPSAPTGVTANATSLNSVSVAWTFTDTADQFAIERCTNNCLSAASWTTFTWTGVSPYPDTTAAANMVYLYRVRAIRSGVSSPNSNNDVASTIAFSTVTSGMTIQAIHLTQLRTAVNGIRAVAGSAPMSFTDASTPGTLIRAVHFTELQGAMNAARQAVNLTAISFSPVVQGGLIQDEHITALRGAVQ